MILRVSSDWLKDLLQRAYVAGFMSSGEGYNGEWHDADGKKAIEDRGKNYGRRVVKEADDQEDRRTSTLIEPDFASLRDLEDNGVVELAGMAHGKTEMVLDRLSDQIRVMVRGMNPGQTIKVERHDGKKGDYTGTLYTVKIVDEE